jgi:uncharacterized protein (TIGR02145 family)
MKRILTICSAIILFFSAFTSSGQDNIPEVKMGNQIWMKENLDVTTFRNGDTIKQVKTQKEWKIAFDNQQPAWCYYFYDDNVYGRKNKISDYSTQYVRRYQKIGKFYNQYALIDPRNIAPIGWSVATAQDWKVLNNYLIENVKHENKELSYFNELSVSRFKVGSKDDLKCNTTGFSGVPTGYGIESGEFFDIFPHLGDLLQYAAINNGYLGDFYMGEGIFGTKNVQKYKTIIARIIIHDNEYFRPYKGDAFYFEVGNNLCLPVRCIKDK